MPRLSVWGPNNVEVNQRTQLMPAGLNPSTCRGRAGLHLGTASQRVSHSNSGLSADWLLTWKSQSAVLLAAGTEETKEHNHTDHNHPAPHLHCFIILKWGEKKKNKKKKQACQTEVKTTAEHTVLRRTTTTKTKRLQTHKCLLLTCGYASIACRLTWKYDCVEQKPITFQAVTWYLTAFGSFFFNTSRDFVLFKKKKSSNSTPVDK